MGKGMVSGEVKARAEGRFNYSIDGAAEYLTVSRSSVKAFIKSGRLPAYRVTSRRVVLRRDDLDRLVLTSPAAASSGRPNRRKAKPEPAAAG
jgi:excisionase family DNA binding protein